MGCKELSGAKETLLDLTAMDECAKWVDIKLSIPHIFEGNKSTKLIIVGQDPTTYNPRNRKSVSCVLNLNTPGVLLTYISEVCAKLGVTLDNVYATNLVKNFFIDTPLNLEKNLHIDVISLFAPKWIPMLKDELSRIPNVPILTLGEGVLKALTNETTELKTFWGYQPQWTTYGTTELRHVHRHENTLSRMIFPFPHYTNRRVTYLYRVQFDAYCEFTRTNIQG